MLSLKVVWQKLFTYTCSYRPEFQYSCGRTSQIWEVSPVAMRATPSEHISRLARHKTAPAGYLEHRPQFEYSCGRSSQIWQTSRTAMTCPPRPHTARLARPKQTHVDYRPSRQVNIHFLACNRLFILMLLFFKFSMLHKGTNYCQSSCKELYTFRSHR